MIAIDLNKHQALDADPKSIQQINFTGNLDEVGSRKMLFIIEKAKETILCPSRKRCKCVAQSILL